MRRALLAAFVVCSGCMHGATHVRSKSAAAEATADSLYWSAVQTLDPSNKSGTLDAGLANLDAYLASPAKLEHAKEATTLRRLVRDAQQLARVVAALDEARASADKPRTESESKGRDEEMVKEIQRLKDELAKAKEELERIKKRLGAPKPSSPDTK